MEPQLDTHRLVEAPEGVELALPIAGPFVRFQAWALDAALRLGLIIFFSFLLATLGGFGRGVLLLLFFVIEFVYPIPFEVLNGGATPGKRALRIRVVHDNGTPIGWNASTLRNLLRIADFLPAAYGFGLVTTLFHPDFKRLGDLVAGTVVVYSGHSKTANKLPPAPPTPPSIPLTLAEQRAVISFANRTNIWTRTRAEELADLAEPITISHGSSGVKKLLGVANWLVGRR